MIYAYIAKTINYRIHITRSFTGNTTDMSTRPEKYTKHELTPKLIP